MDKSLVTFQTKDLSGWVSDLRPGQPAVLFEPETRERSGLPSFSDRVPVLVGQYTISMCYAVVNTRSSS